MEIDVYDLFQVISALTFGTLALVFGTALFLFLRSDILERKVWRQRAKVEMHRIAVAFGIEKTKGFRGGAGGWVGRGKVELLEVVWILDDEDDWRIVSLHIDINSWDSRNGVHDTWISYDRSKHQYKVEKVGELGGELMARAAYRLGFDESILAQLPLTAHEKLELRLSLPHEFWPKAWLDEGKQSN